MPWTADYFPPSMRNLPLPVRQPHPACRCLPQVILVSEADQAPGAGNPVYRSDCGAGLRGSLSPPRCDSIAAVEHFVRAMHAVGLRIPRRPGRVNP
jgi:hypothetical protein